jgi:hypothetical protein
MGKSIAKRTVKLKSIIAPSHSTHHVRAEPAGEQSYPKSVASTCSTPDGKTISKGALITGVFSIH